MENGSLAFLGPNKQEIVEREEIVKVFLPIGY